MYKYNEFDFVKCTNITEENHEGLNVGQIYKVMGATNFDGNVVYGVADMLGNLHHSIDRFELLAREDVDIYCVEPIDACEPKFDSVANPSHYTNRKFEVIEYIEDNMSFEAMNGWLEGNIIKYISRYKSKNGVQDLKKAQFYLNRLISRLED